MELSGKYVRVQFLGDVGFGSRVRGNKENGRGHRSNKILAFVIEPAYELHSPRLDMLPSSLRLPTALFQRRIVHVFRHIKPLHVDGLAEVGSGIDSLGPQLLLDAKNLVELGQAFRSRWRARLDLTRT